jgi:hypothetical protein
MKSMPDLAATLASLPLELARPDLNRMGGQSPNEQGRCAYCMRPMQGDKLWFNGCFAHARCAGEAERRILGEDAGPGLLEHLDYLDDLETFVRRFATEAAALGLDRTKLETAIATAME